MASNKCVPLAQYLKRDKRRRRVIWLGALTGLFTLIAVDHHGLLLYRGDWKQYHLQSFRVVAVVDGDTIDIDTPDGDKPHTRVRFWGIDTPEMAKLKENQPAQPFAQKATQLTRELCLNQMVTLQLERHRVRGRFGRVLAHVILQDRTVLNESLLAAGFARIDERFMHGKQEHYRLIAQQAAFDWVGLHGKSSD